MPVLFEQLQERGILDSMYEFADSVTDFIREHDIGGQAGRDIADSLDETTEREDRESDS